MKVSEVLIRIKNAINEPDDLTGKASNVLFKNALIVEQLKNSLDLYAANVKGIEAIHSVPMGNNVRLGVGPTDMIRGQGYKFVYLYNGTMKYELKYLNVIEANRIYDMSNISGIPESYTVWNNEISIYPLNSFTAKTTQLNGGINSTDTTITVDSTDGYPRSQGNITIGTEKIRYTSKTSTTFTGCVRGSENTTAASHSDDDTVTNNNLVIYYYRKHFVITVDANDNISQEQLDKVMEIPDEHIEPISDLVAYKLLLKIDAARAERYKIDAAQFFADANIAIEGGYASDNTGTNIKIGNMHDFF